MAEIPALHHKTYGEGEIDILLVHGWASSGDMWHNIVPHFQHVRFWSLDLPGFGETPLPQETLDINDYMSAVIRFCDEHMLRPQVIIAHSMGGLITLKMLHIRPELAQQLVLICPVVTGHFGIGGIASELLRNPLGELLLRATERVWPLLQDSRLLESALSPWGFDAEFLRRAQVDFPRMVPQAGIETLISMARENMEQFLTEMTLPTWIAVGAQDTTVPPYEGKTAALYMPNASLTVFEQSRHHPHDEQPDDFLPELQAFLAQFGIS